ncbi:hypothetical protein QJS04_geneDACA013737 [Acorus gramineus]|uniref:Uncharacterized protein n=1 Tax=Acorus gramineus TaxID=55184 RepID=A0AAV9B0F1_ACOGR|nr:hypothetical protein QJS04_geneDACA013737 [Acorus gramineus]
MPITQLYMHDCGHPRALSSVGVLAVYTKVLVGALRLPAECVESTGAGGTKAKKGPAFVGERGGKTTVGGSGNGGGEGTSGGGNTTGGGGDGTSGGDGMRTGGGGEGTSGGERRGRGREGLLGKGWEGKVQRPQPLKMYL